MKTQDSMKIQGAEDLRVAQEAARWMRTLPTAGSREREAFAGWLLESRRHVRNFLLLSALEEELPRLDPGRRWDVDALLQAADRRVTPFRRVLEESRSAGRKTRTWLGVAAGVLVALGVGTMVWGKYFENVYATDVGEQQTLKLPDGSRVELNAQSRVRVRFSDKRREVRLLSGEALFTVEQDAKRPFEVAAGKTVVRALGTQFNVYDRPEGLRVSVLEGKVSVENPEIPGNRGTSVLSAGEEARVDDRGAVQKETAPDVARRVAWRQRVLEFRDEALSSVIAEFNRYNTAPRFRLESEALGARQYSGVFKADDPGSLAQLLAQEEDVAVERRGDEIVIGKR